MSKLEDLIQELCPNGVEFVTLGSVLQYEQPTKYIVKDTNYSDEYETPVLTAGQTFILGYTNETDGIYSATKENPVIIFDDFTTTFKWVDFNFKVKSSAMKLLTSKDNNIANIRYLYHVMSTIQYIPVDHSRQWIGTYSQFSIPLPPMPVQEEIVRILDSFTELTEELIEELKEELIARKKQYEYYRDELLTFGDDVEWKNLGEMFEVKNGLNKEKSAFGKGYPIVNFTDVYNKRWLDKSSLKGLVKVTPDETYRYSAKKGDVFFTRTSETREDIGMSSTLIEDIPNCVFSGFVLRARPTTGLLLPKFCSYYFSTPQVRKDIIRYASFTTRATTTGSKLSKIKIPLPSLDEQQRIVDILDRFDKLCNDISEDLPAEIEARKKQYKYYRDKLLTFK